MKRNQWKWRRLFLAAVVLLFTGIAAGTLLGDHLLKSDEKKPDFTAPPQPLATQKKKSSLDERAAAIASKMTDEQKAGQLLFIGVAGKDLDEATKRTMQHCRPGGVILFDRNMQTPAQVKSLLGDLNEVNRQQQPVELFIGIDEEGGSVSRMREYLTVMPAAAELGARGNFAAAADCAAQSARELKELGIQINFAPVADLGLGDGRSYSENPETTANFVRAVARAYQREGVLCALKHFPGMGKAKVDPHVDASQINAPRTVLEKEDFVPFAAAIGNLGHEDFMVMVSHLKYRALDSVYPASLSEKIMTDLLRQEMGYRGLIITDDMEMGGVANSYSFAEMGYLALKAGADIVLVCHEYEHERDVYDGIYAAIRDGRLDRALVDDKVRRVIRAKLKYFRGIK